MSLKRIKPLFRSSFFFFLWCVGCTGLHLGPPKPHTPPRSFAELYPSLSTQGTTSGVTRTTFPLLHRLTGWRKRRLGGKKRFFFVSSHVIVRPALAFSPIGAHTYFLKAPESPFSHEQARIVCTPRVGSPLKRVEFLPVRKSLSVPWSGPPIHP